MIFSKEKYNKFMGVIPIPRRQRMSFYFWNQLYRQIVLIH